jgi:purine-binding chemotaxis protein CheW
MRTSDRARAAGTAAAASEQQFATFVVDRLLFGVGVLRVQEVLRYQEMTPVPRAAEVIEGLINLRGQIVTAIDVRRRLGLRPRDTDRTPMNMVVRSDDGAVSLLVDEIGDVLDVDESAFEPVPENISPGIRDLTTGVYKLKDRLLLVLDTAKVIAVDTTVGRQRAH